MSAPFPAPSGTIQALLPQVLDSFQARGFSCRHPICARAASGRCVQLLCVRLTEPARLSELQLQNAPGHGGCCLNAKLLAPLRVEYLQDGCRLSIETTLCLPICGVLRMNCGSACDFCPLLEIKNCRLSLTNGCPELCFDFCAVVYALCRALVHLPCLPAGEPDCAKIFSLPLYPRFKTPPG